MTFQTGDHYSASAASIDAHSKVKVTLYIDGIKTTPDETADLGSSYGIGGYIE